MKKTNLILGFFNFAILLYCLFRFGLPFINSDLQHSDSIGVFLAAQANIFAVVQVMLGILAICIAIVAIWGYNQIQLGAAIVAEKKINEVVPEQIKQAIEKFSIEEWERMVYEKRSTKNTQSSLNEAFSESIKRLDDDFMDGQNDL